MVPLQVVFVGLGASAMEGARLMACKGCKDKIERARSERQVLDRKLTNALSAAITKLHGTDPLFARQLMALNAENSIGTVLPGA